MALALFFSGSFFVQGRSQNVINGCDYIRELKVNICHENLNTSPGRIKDFISGYNNFEEPFEDEAKNSLDGKVMNVYFQTNSSNITKRDSTDLRRYVLDVIKPTYLYEKLMNFNVEGFADFRGDIGKNYSLSSKRAESVANYLEDLAHNIVSPSIKIYVSAFGEVRNHKGKNLEDLKKDRVVRIIPNNNPVIRALENCNADFYLLDQSGSMNKDNFWKSLQNFSFPESSHVFSFSKLILPEGFDKNNLDSLDYPEFFHTFDIKTEVAYGKTPYYSAMDKFLSIIPSNKVIDILVNGESNFGDGTPDDIIKKTKEKNLVLNMIGINVSRDFENQLIEIANATNGNYYFLKNFNRKLL